MATCTEVAEYLARVANRSLDPAHPLPEADLARLATLQLIQRLTPEQFSAVQQELQRIESADAEVDRAAAARALAAGEVATDTRKSHSILFHLEGIDREHALLARLGQEQSALQQLDAQLAARRASFAQLLVQKALLDSAVPSDGGYVALTGSGRVALRDLSVRLYRVADDPFDRYWSTAQDLDGQLAAVASGAAPIARGLAPLFGATDPSYAWAVGLGLVKIGGDPAALMSRYAQAYAAMQKLAPNLENRIMASEVVTALGTPVPEGAALLQQLLPTLKAAHVPADSAAGVGAILLLGRRSDGTFATDVLPTFLGWTPSYEAAALLATHYGDVNELRARFAGASGLFQSWGYAPSEDTALSATFLAISEVPQETVATKMPILVRGISAYLEYPLVAAAILASLADQEANETLNLLEKAYEVLGTRTGPMSQSQLIALAVRAIHGLRIAPPDAVDGTARTLPTPTGAAYAGLAPRIWMPVYIVHASYYATFSGMGGIHPAHVHGFGGGGWGGGFGG